MALMKPFLRRRRRRRRRMQGSEYSVPLADIVSVEEGVPGPAVPPLLPGPCTARDRLCRIRYRCAGRPI